MHKPNTIDRHMSLLENSDDIVQNNPWKTILIYIVFGFAWILFSDQVLAMFITDPAKFLAFQTYKGWIYVSVTAVLLYFLIRIDNFRIFNLTKSLTEKNQDLTSFSEELIAVEEELQLKISDLNTSMISLEKYKNYIDEIYNNSNAIILLWNLEGDIIDVNDYFVELTKYERDEIKGKKMVNYMHVEELFSAPDFIERLILSSSLKNRESRLVKKDGKSMTILWNDKIIKNPNSDESFIASFGVDLSLEKEKENKIYELAFTDKLTGLKNRVVFESDLSELVENNVSFTLFYLDFDNFKNLNDLLGHNFGDQFLYDYSRVLQKSLPEIVVYRWSGDEFLLIQKSSDPSDIDNTIDVLMKITKRKWLVGQMEYYPSICLGISQSPRDGSDASLLHQNVEMALYKAKDIGKSQVKYYESTFQLEVEKSIRIDSLINKVIQDDAFKLFFQPIYQLDGNAITGFEVLLRWHAQDLTISTGDFIEVAEKTGQIIEIDRWVLNQSFLFFKEHFENDDYTLSINLSPRTLTAPNLIPYISEKIQTLSINPNKIEFEITEHSLIDNFDESLNVIKAIKSLGFRISLDDFGTRFSSLNYLSKIPFDTLKIDKTYIDHVIEEGNNQIIVEQIIQLAKRLGLKIVAEGIETTEQREVLSRLGCLYGQGYLMSRPLSGEHLLDLLQNQLHG
ncbi:MAG TPA: EAL domain-containing protein [Fusibacter sp.]|nr:EAL domain-containing protein [Fusibacter sp.]